MASVFTNLPHCLIFPFINSSIHWPSILLASFKVHTTVPFSRCPDRMSEFLPASPPEHFQQVNIFLPLASHTNYTRGCEDSGRAWLACSSCPCLLCSLSGVLSPWGSPEGLLPLTLSYIKTYETVPDIQRTGNFSGVPFNF